jgi:NADP-dependent 3-hydroxy acid dehydrogenase YdfG
VALANNGFTVIAAARRLDRLEELAKNHANIEPYFLDVTDEKSVSDFVSQVAGKNISVLINNAGGAFDSQSVENADVEVWRKSYDVNVLGTVRMVRALLPALKVSGNGTVVLISSTAGYAAYEYGGSYVAAKKAEVSLARTMRLELNGLPIRIIEIAPGMVKTDEFAKVRFGGDIEKAEAVYKGVAEPLVAEDVAEAVRWTVMLPGHVNIDSLVIRPVAQAANHKVHRVL